MSTIRNDIFLYRLVEIKLPNNHKKISPDKIDISVTDAYEDEGYTGCVNQRKISTIQFDHQPATRISVKMVV